MCLIQDKEFERLIKFAKQKPSKKLAQIKQSHEKSVKCDENVEELGGEKWSVQSSTNHSQRYQVNFVKYEPCCVHICKKCRICLHMLMCSCHDYSVKQNICKHIHSVMRLQQQKNKNDDVSPEEFRNRIFDPPTEQNNSLIEQELNLEPINDDSE